MAEDLIVNPALVIPGRELRERFSRASGPGGQGVNTTDSRVELSFDLARSRSLPPWLRERMLDRLSARLAHGVLTVAAGEHRAQLANRDAARARLKRLLSDAAAAPPPPRRPTRPKRAAKERRLSAKRHRGQLKRRRSGDDDDGG